MNSLIVRLHDAVEAQRQFVSDAAHELRTPLAAMQIQVENLSRETRGAHDGATGTLARGVRRATALVSQLLHSGEAGGERRRSRTKRWTSMRCSSRSVADHAALAERKQVDLELNLGMPSRLPRRPA